MILEGIIPPLVTPFDDREEPDEQAHRAEVRYLIEKAGVHGLAVGGSTGEGQTLTCAELRRLVAWTVDEAGGRVPVIAGIIANSTREAIERGQAVTGLGVAALQVTPVHYLFAPDEESSIRHFATIAETTAMPVIIYNVIPWSYQPAPRLARMLREVPGIIGVKQSAADLKTLADLLLAPERARIFSAVDALLYPSFVLGAHGSIGAIVTAAPEWSVALWMPCGAASTRRHSNATRSCCGSGTLSTAPTCQPTSRPPWSCRAVLAAGRVRPCRPRARNSGKESRRRSSDAVRCQHRSAP